MTVFGTFLVGYILTRLLLPVAFRQVDDALAERVEGLLAEQDADNARALALLARQLDPSRQDDPLPTDAELRDAFTKATAAVRQVIFQQARETRRRSWRDDPELSARTVPVLRALVDSDTGNNFEFRGQLGYALKDRAGPGDLEAADTALTEAITLRDRRGQVGWLMYELNRAHCRILLVRPDDQIVPDLATVAAAETVRPRVSGYPDILSWLQQRGMGIGDLVGATA